MPTFNLIPLPEARLKTATGRRGQFLQQYADYIQQLPEDQAGRLQVTEDEKVSTVRRRLTVAADALGKKLTVKRLGDELYFWIESAQDQKPRQRRQRRSTPEGPHTLSVTVEGPSGPEDEQARLGFP